MTTGELRTAREHLGLPQHDVAEALGVDLRSYRPWEQGERGSRLCSPCAPP